MFLRLIKTIIGLALIPACYVSTVHVVRLIGDLQSVAGHDIPPSTWGLMIGFALWIVLYLALPRPVRTYVLAHELTHALWGWLTGARIKGIKVGPTGGHVKLTSTNFLVTLAPYFFPFYTVLVIILYAALSIFFDMRTYEPFWMGCVGLTWSFHLTFTISMLKTNQPDIEEHGRVFSYAVIYLLNVLGAALWVVAVTPPSILSFFAELWNDMLVAYEACGVRCTQYWTYIEQFVADIVSGR
ncbi:MAG: M50 family metallopeptidase [Verrucomicrobia bacterium]|nr:M50 family metallopeptidase [Verrucomicrobiota bacterium]